MTITALSEVADLRLWVEGDLNTAFADGGDVTLYWPEAGAVTGVSGDLGSNVFGPHPPSWHAGVLHGKPVVRFVTNDYATGDQEEVQTGAGLPGRDFYDEFGDAAENLAAPEGFTVFVLARLAVSHDYPEFAELLAFQASGNFGSEFWNQDLVGAEVPTLYVWAREEGGARKECYFPWPLGAWALVEAWYDGTTFSVQINDGCPGPAPLQSHAMSALDSGTGSILFRIETFTSGDYGEVAGAGVYRRGLTSGERADVREYFVDKYALCTAARRRSRVGVLK